MEKKMLRKSLILGMSLSSLIFIGCSDDDDDSTNKTTTFTVKIENISNHFDSFSNGVFNTPVGATSPGPLMPGNSYQFSFNAPNGSYLSFATMFVPSNDFFYGAEEGGIALWDASGNQLSGDITSMIKLWDAGTEVNQEPGIGTDQPQRQSAANTGAADSNNTVRLAEDTFSNLPSVSDVIKVTLTPTSANDFTLTIENISDENTLTTSDGATQGVPLAPGFWTVHSSGNPLFIEGEADFGDGLEGVAEDGSLANLETSFMENPRYSVPFAPGIWAVHSEVAPFFKSGEADRGEGLEAIAEDGDPSSLNGMLDGKSGISSVGIFNTPKGSSSPGPLGKGNSYEFTVEVPEGEKLSFATMFIQSNDLFVGPDENGITLWDASGNAISGDITSQMQLWDAGTEVNEQPGIGENQPPRQSGGNTGIDENGTVRVVNDSFSYPNLSEIIKVTITP